MVSDILSDISQIVRTRATTVPTPTPVRQDASEPATRAVARRGALARGRGRGRERMSSRGRGQTTGPTSNMAVTPPPTDEVVREGEFVTYQFQGNAKMWWWSYVEYQPAQTPPMSWASFSSLFMEKDIPPTLRDKRRDEFHEPRARKDVCYCL